MEADETTANEMTKNLTDLTSALRQTEMANGATGQAANMPAPEKSIMA